MKNEKKKKEETEETRFFSFLFRYSFGGLVMLAAVEGGDVEKLAELMRQNPGFNVNMALDEDGFTLLHYASLQDSRSVVIPLLLAHPDMDVNVKDEDGQSPFLGLLQWTPLLCL